MFGVLVMWFLHMVDLIVIMWHMDLTQQHVPLCLVYVSPQSFYAGRGGHRQPLE